MKKRVLAAVFLLAAVLYLAACGGSGNEEFGTLPDYPIKEGGDALQSCLELIGENGKN